MTASTKSRKGSSGMIFTLAYLFSMVLLYIGERMVLESTTMRGVLGSMGVIGILLAIVGRQLRRRALPAPARAVENRLLGLYLLGLLALLIYLAQADFVMEKVRGMFADARGAERYQGVLTALWPTVWICAVLPIIFIEISYAPMDMARTLELDRVRRSARSGALLAMTACLLLVLNFIFNAYNEKVDLSYFKTTRPSESSRKMVQNLSEKVEVRLFFPGTNEVLDEVRTYFDDLAHESKYLGVKQVDQVMEPEMAKELSVSQNGAVILLRGKQHQQITLDTTLQRAKRKLKQLDNEFQTAFRKLLKQQKIAYLTVGHEERTREQRDGVRGTSIRELTEWLERLNIAVKDLGLSQGLASDVPADADVVIVAGPRKDFLPAEIDGLIRYLKKGGRMMVFLDPEAGLSFDALLNPFGLKYTPVKLANDRMYVRVTSTPADRHILYSNRFSAHPSVSTLTRNAHRTAAILVRTGYLEEVPPAPATKTRVQFTIHGMPFTWNDVNSNLTFDAGTEQRKSFELAAVVTMDVPDARQAADTKIEKNKKHKKNKKDEPQMRLIVAADSDMIADGLFRLGNGHFFLDGVKWLTGEEEIIGETTSEEDVRIVHTRKEDQLWFYLTIFAVPALVLAVGIYYTRRIRRRKP